MTEKSRLLVFVSYAGIRDVASEVSGGTKYNDEELIPYFYAELKRIGCIEHDGGFDVPVEELLAEVVRNGVSSEAITRAAKKQFEAGTDYSPDISEGTIRKPPPNLFH